jgi:hypothetical protein
MPPIRDQKRQKLVEQEGNIEAAIYAYNNQQVTSVREAAQCPSFNST